MAESRPAVFSETAAPPLLLRAAGRVRANARLIGLLALGHLIFLLVDGVLRFIVLGLFGAVLTSSFSVSIVLGQAYLPRRHGMASGLMVGFAMGTGGLAAAALGGVADRWGVPAALWISALLPLAAFVVARFLPAPRGRAPGIA